MCLHTLLLKGGQFLLGLEWYSQRTSNESIPNSGRELCFDFKFVPRRYLKHGFLLSCRAFL